MLGVLDSKCKTPKLFHLLLRGIFRTEGQVLLLLTTRCWQALSAYQWLCHRDREPSRDWQGGKCDLRSSCSVLGASPPQQRCFCFLEQGQKNWSKTVSTGNALDTELQFICYRAIWKHFVPILGLKKNTHCKTPWYQQKEIDFSKLHDVKLSELLLLRHIANFQLGFKPYTFSSPENS